MVNGFEAATEAAAAQQHARNLAVAREVLIREALPGDWLKQLAMRVLRFELVIEEEFVGCVTKVSVFRNGRRVAGPIVETPWPLRTIKWKDVSI